MSDLKPCPFCGSTKIKRYGFRSSDLHGFIHVCEINGESMVKIESRFFKTEEEATEAWNRRAVNVPDTNVGDTISRQAAIKAVCERECTMLAPCEGECKAIMALRDLPATQPQRMRGRWIDINGDGTLFRCSSCDEIVCCAQNNYCPNCGADMREEQDETE